LGGVRWFGGLFCTKGGRGPCRAAGPQAAEHPAGPAFACTPLPQRRLILGAVVAVVLGAFALVPTGQLQLSKPSKPLFFYLVPLMR